MRHTGDGVGHRKLCVSSPSAVEDPDTDAVDLAGENEPDEDPVESWEEFLEGFTEEEDYFEEDEDFIGDSDLENEILSYGYENDGEESEDEGREGGEEEIWGTLGPEDGEIDDEADEYYGYAPL